MPSIPPPKKMGDSKAQKNNRKSGYKVPRNNSGLVGQINQWMAEAFRLMGTPELIGNVPIKMNSRMTSARGRARCKWVNGKATNLRLDFSPSLMKLSDENGRKQCVFHECAHLVDYHKGTFVQEKAHGPSWKRYMIMAGQKPERCHNVQALKPHYRKKRRRVGRRRRGA